MLYIYNVYMDGTWEATYGDGSQEFNLGIGTRACDGSTCNLERRDPETGETFSSWDYFTINPGGRVP